MNKHKPLRLVAFASGRGSNLDAILKNIDAGTLEAEVVGVISNNSQSGALENARQRGIPDFYISGKTHPNEKEFISRLLHILTDLQTEMIILAGYMKKIPVELIDAYPNKILNIHPALLPSFGGKGLYGHFVHEAVLEYGCCVSGATVHLVDAEYDTGAPIVQKCVPVYSDDTPETLAARVLKVEHTIFSEAIQLFAEGRVVVQEGKVFIMKSKN